MLIDLQPLAPRAAIARVPPLSAVVRWRRRWLRGETTRVQRDALDFVPTAYGIIWNAGPMKGTSAPGLRRGVRRRHAAALCKTHKLPPLAAFSVGRPQLEAIWAMPGTKGTLSLLVVMKDGLELSDRQKILARTEALAALFGPLSMTFRVCAVADIPDDQLAVWLNYGALLGGELPEAWLRRSNAITPTPEIVEALCIAAPTPLCAIFPLLLLYHQSSFLSGNALRFDSSAPTWGSLGNRAYADPELMLAHWLAKDDAMGALAFGTLRLTATRPSARDAAAIELGTLMGEPFPIAGRPRDRAYRLWSLADRCALLASLAVRRIERSKRRPLYELLRRELRSNGVPRAFVGPLRASMFEIWPQGPGRIYHRKVPGGVEWMSANGWPLGRGRSLAMLRGRALARVAGSGLTPPSALGDSTSWMARLAARLELPVSEPTSIFYLSARSKPGPESSLSLGRSTLVVLSPDRRPTIHRLKARDVMPRLLGRLDKGDKIELVALEPEANPAQAALTRLCAAKGPGRDSIAFADGGLAWILNGGRVRHPRIAIACQRPRHILWTNEAPPRTVRVGTKTLRTIECRGTISSEDTAALIWVDDGGHRMSETVPLDDLSRYLDETQTILRATGAPALISSQLAPELLTLAMRRRNSVRSTQTLEIEGALPFGLKVKVGAEWFGAGQRFPLVSAAQVLLSKWPPHQRGILAFSRVDLGDATPLLRLYARSAIRRRLLHRFKQLEGT